MMYCNQKWFTEGNMIIFIKNVCSSKVTQCDYDSTINFLELLKNMWVQAKETNTSICINYESSGYLEKLILLHRYPAGYPPGGPPGLHQFGLYPAPGTPSQAATLSQLERERLERLGMFDL